MYLLGARLVLGCRDLEKCELAKKEIVKSSYNTNIACKYIDLASVKSIRKFAEEINKGKLLFCIPADVFLEISQL